MKQVSVSRDEQRVSLVIQVVLRVAIKVILAALLAGIVLHLGGDLTETGGVTFDWDSANDEVEVYNLGEDSKLRFKDGSGNSQDVSSLGVTSVSLSGGTPYDVYIVKNGEEKFIKEVR